MSFFSNIVCAPTLQRLTEQEAEEERLERFASNHPPTPSIAFTLEDAKDTMDTLVARETVPEKATEQRLFQEVDDGDTDDDGSFQTALGFETITESIVAESTVNENNVLALDEIPEDPGAKLELLVAMGHDKTEAMNALFMCGMDFVKAQQHLAKDEEDVTTVPDLVPEGSLQGGIKPVSFFVRPFVSSLCSHTHLTYFLADSHESSEA